MFLRRRENRFYTSRQKYICLHNEYRTKLDYSNYSQLDLALETPVRRWPTLRCCTLDPRPNLKAPLRTCSFSFSFHIFALLLRMTWPLLPCTRHQLKINDMCFVLRGVYQIWRKIQLVLGNTGWKYTRECVPFRIFISFLSLRRLFVVCRVSFVPRYVT